MVIKEDITGTSKTIPDIINQELSVLFCGINPGLYSAAIGHHFGHPQNRFWPTLYKSGFTPRLFTAYEDRMLLSLNLGVTNLVARATRNAQELDPNEFIKGKKILEEKIKMYNPQWIAFVGIQAYRLAYQQPHAKPGLQPGGIFNTRIWVLPNPSGLNAYYNKEGLTKYFSQLKQTISM